MLKSFSILYFPKMPRRYIKNTVLFLIYEFNNTKMVCSTLSCNPKMDALLRAWLILCSLQISATDLTPFSPSKTIAIFSSTDHFLCFIYPIPLYRDFLPAYAESLTSTDCLCLLSKGFSIPAYIHKSPVIEQPLNIFLNLVFILL